jgi:hypothetical protein
MSLSPKELQFCSYIEQVWRLKGELPGYELVADRLGLVSHQEYERYWKSTDVREYLVGIGIDVAKIESGRTEVLTPQQILCINTVLDPNDKRSDSRKFKELGITTKLWDQWKSDPAFAAYYRARIDKLIEGAEEVDRTLYERARDGDVSAIKFYNELTGRYRPQEAARGQDIRLLQLKIMEVITRNLQGHPEILHQIGLELEALADTPNDNYPVGNTVVVVPAKKEIGF